LGEVRPEAYTHVVIVCGPYRRHGVMNHIPRDFRHCRRIGIDLSILDSFEAARAEFDELFERDSDRTSRPELAFVSRFSPVPIVGLMLVHPQNEYGSRALHGSANQQISRLLSEQECAIVRIDTLIVNNPAGLRTASEIESIIARMDCVITTRLHGTVLALKHGVPALVIDPIAGGAKVSAQCRVAGWPICFTAEQLSTDALREAFSYCTSGKAREQARESANVATRLLDELRREFLKSL